MRILLALFALPALLLAPLTFGQDKDDAKKPDEKKMEATKKPDEKKSEEKKTEAKKEAPKTYIAAFKIVGKIAEVDTKDMTIKIEIGGGRYPKKEEIKLHDDVKVRQISLPERFDDNNKAKPYTPAEKAKLKGDNFKLPGYTSELSKLAPGQMVEIELSKNKPVPGASKKKDAVEEKPFATMVVIAKDEPKAMDKKKK